MTDLNNENMNTPEYWDEVYSKELETGKRRIDNDRLQFVVNEMKTWRDHNPHDVPMILDVGCGNGEMLRLLHVYFPTWRKFGVDITPKTIGKNRELDPTFNYQVGTALDIPYSPQFSIVFCGETLEHLESPETAIKELFRVTNPGGYVICSLPCNHNNYSPEHLHEFSVWDAIKMTEPYGELINLDVKCSGLSTIWSVKKA